VRSGPIRLSLPVIRVSILCSPILILLQVLLQVLLSRLYVSDLLR
jgi:hypothetical protein